MPGSSPGMTSAFRGVRLRIASHAPTSIFRQPKRFQTCLHALATQSARAVDKIFRPVEGVGNAGCPLHPRSRVHLVVVERTRVTTSTPESPGIPARNGFNGLCRALPGDRALLPPSSADMFCLSPVGPTQLRELDASVGASGPHDFAVREKRLSSACC